MPTVQELHDTFREKGLIVAGVTDDDPKRAIAFMRAKKYTYPMLWDNGGNLGGQLGVTSIPFTVFIGRDGRIVGDFTGRFSVREASERLDAILSESSQAMGME